VIFFSRSAVEHGVAKADIRGFALEKNAEIDEEPMVQTVLAVELSCK
jgi:hypothetical protein